MTDTLVERLEAATGCDDQLDRDIARWCYENGGIAGVTYDPALWAERHGGEFTRSLDVAMTLVPDEWAIEGLTMWPASPLDVKSPSPAQSRVTLVGTSTERWRSGLVWGHGGKDGRAEAVAPTPALALCAAALRARSQTQEGENGASADTRGAS